MGTTLHKKRMFDARKDRLDLRDRIYQPMLRSLPHIYPDFNDLESIIHAYQNANLILDQGKDGACTGFALASTINYLLWRQGIERRYTHPRIAQASAIQKVSSKMLYNLARIYDEWDGEDYEGSSCRGAMKGWHKHGVCQEDRWSMHDPEPKEGWKEQAVDLPLGAYYRVKKDSITDMQSALYEVGALYASASIHDGWWHLKKFANKTIRDLTADIPYIPYEEFSVGQHAFVIVGYTKYGFIIQNSWGVEWGNGGFAILSYKDWLEHGMDVWVAVMGVPVDVETTPNTFSSLSLNSQTNEAVEGSKIIKRALSYQYRENSVTPISEQEAYNHALVLNSYGRAKQTLIYTSTLERTIEIICYDNIKQWLDDKQKHQKVVVYALGGFFDEKEYISKVRVMAPYFLANGVYPIFLLWQNSYYQGIDESINLFFEKMLSSYGQNVDPKTVLQERIALNRAIENHCRKISTRAIWSELKEKGIKANAETIETFHNKQGALHMLTNALQKLQQEYGYLFDLHAIAHSAGAQLIATEWLNQLADRGMQMQSLHLIAPTLTMREANEYIPYAQMGQLLDQDRIHVYMLDQALEREDKVSKYDQSLLMLIS
ncbi:MAG TPA: hypothetical protein ENK86_01400, partial [Campylobacterales bacterium]|nr:hypothetical protein [Campylobacterales bacterium]